MTFGTATLTCERSHLTLHLGDQVVETRKVDRRFVETPFRAATTIAIQTNARGFFEQFATVVRTIGQQRVDHPTLDDYARVGTKACTTHEILDIAQAARCAIQQILAFPRTHQPPCQNHFLERDRQFAVVVLEVERHFRHVHLLPCRRAVEYDVFHLRATHCACALFAKHPAYRIGDVGLAASIGSDNRRHAALKQKLCVIGKRLESVDLELREPH